MKNRNGFLSCQSQEARTIFLCFCFRSDFMCIFSCYCVGRGLLLSFSFHYIISPLYFYVYACTYWRDNFSTLCFFQVPGKIIMIASFLETWGFSYQEIDCKAERSITCQVTEPPSGRPRKVQVWLIPGLVLLVISSDLFFWLLALESKPPLGQPCKLFSQQSLS